ncbi:DUF805 domain-containing protein [Agreia pratensis]|uniref:DUF805 domain-containing protein n=1 Tax=Agreia pratensis TaxID=150121 RepID=UPI00188CDBB8|nr:DUF805 domain-containing protein [Agreia pratensis]MBF4635117.1 DUF805 domain-containing protein [Agreia pratensis]
MSFTTTSPRMSFGTAIATGFRKYADFNGRAGVAEFWWFILFVVLVNSGTRIFDMMLPGLPQSFGGVGLVSYGTAEGPISALWTLGTVVPVLAIAVRRLRDGGNAWTQLFWLLVPLFGPIWTAIRLCDPPTLPATVDGEPVQAPPVPGAPVQDAPVRDAPSD